MVDNALPWRSLAPFPVAAWHQSLDTKWILDTLPVRPDLSGVLGQIVKAYITIVLIQGFNNFRFILTFFADSFKQREGLPVNPFPRFSVLLNSPSEKASWGVTFTYHLTQLHGRSYSEWS